MGYVQRLAVGTLKPTSFAGTKPHPGITAPTSIFGTTGSPRACSTASCESLSVPEAGSATTAATLTGRSRAPLALGPQALPLSVDAGSVSYVPDASRPTAEDLTSAAIDPRCHTVVGVLHDDGIDHTVFGGRPSTVARLLDGLLGSAPSRTYHPASACRVDHTIQWSGLIAFFEHNWFVGYEHSPSRTTVGGPILATAKGLRVGDTFARARQLYGRAFQTSAAQGGSWAMRTPQGRLYGYATGLPIGLAARSRQSTRATSVAPP